jgi:hypothetical protein
MDFNRECVRVSCMGLEEFLNDPKFLHSTSNGLKLRMAFLTELIRAKKTRIF